MRMQKLRRVLYNTNPNMKDPVMRAATSVENAYRSSVDIFLNEISIKQLPPILILGGNFY